MPLTQHSVETAKPREKPYELRDNKGRGHVKELLLRVQPSGAKAYYVQIARGRREKVGSGSLTLEAARKKARTLIGMAADGHDFQAERRIKKRAKQQTLRSYIDEGFGEYAEANIASHKDMIRNVRRQFAHCLDKPMTEISELDMARWRKERGNSVTVQTMQRELSYLKAILNRAVSDKLIPAHQLRDYRFRPTLHDKHGVGERVRFLTSVEEDRLRVALKSRDAEMKKKRASANVWRSERGYEPLPALSGYADYLEPLVLVAMLTGIRRGDLLRLSWADINLSRSQVTFIVGKASHARRKAGKPVKPVTLPLASEAVSVLRRLKKQSTNDIVFTGSSGQRLSEVKKSFENLMKRAELDDFHFHDLRHHFASKLVMSGVDILTVSKLMTHSDIKLTMIYAHLSPDHKAAALERAFGGKS